MSPDTRKAAYGVLTSFLIVICASLLAGAAKADGPSKEDLQNLEDIKSNQEIIEENREAHELFEQAKAWNEAEVAELNKNGYTVNWQNMQLIPVSDSF